MTEADKRVEDLLGRWLASVERHTRYLALDDAAYARVEHWPPHQRPNSLVVNLARSRLRELQAHMVERRDAGDTRFAEALELMSFLTGLLGSEHLQRFIPLATGKPPDTSVSATVEQPRLRTAARTASTHKPSTGTHRRPARAAAPTPAATPSPVPARPATRTPASARTPSTTSAAPRAAAPRATAPPAAAAGPASDAVSRQVIADAARMLAWGREWPAVAGLIARMADRPPEAEVWKILRAHRGEILAKARRSAG
jgi:Tfp pilus assembly protein FimV